MNWLQVAVSAGVAAIVQGLTTAYVLGRYTEKVDGHGKRIGDLEVKVDDHGTRISFLEGRHAHKTH